MQAEGGGRPHAHRVRPPRARHERDAQRTHPPQHPATGAPPGCGSMEIFLPDQSVSVGVVGDAGDAQGRGGGARGFAREVEAPAIAPGPLAGYPAAKVSFHVIWKFGLVN